MQPLAERVQNVFNALDTSAHKMAVRHGMNRSSLFNLVDPERRPSFDMLERLCIAEPRISAEYLLRGEGEPLRDAQRAATLTTVEELRHFRDSLDKRIQELSHS